MKKSNASEKLLLDVHARTVFGKKLKKYRIQGFIPGNIFGPEYKSHSIGIQYKDFVKTYKVAKETGIVYLHLDKEEVPVLIKLVQHHPVNDTIVHVDFRKIDLKKKIQTEVPVMVIGISEAVTQKSGVLLTQSENLLVEALPGDIPHEIEVDISVIKELGQEIKVANLPKSAAYEIKTEPGKVVVSVVEHKEESITPETTAAPPEVLTEAKEGEERETAAGAPAAGEPKKEAAPSPDKAAKSEKKEEKK